MSNRGLALLCLFVVVVIAGSIGGAYLLYDQRHSGEKTTATVTDCNVRLARQGGTVCRGTWVQGGSLLEGGRVVTGGTIEGAGKGDLGKKLDVRVRGDTAYTNSLRIPIVIGSLGLLVGLVGAVRLWQEFVDRRRARRT